MKNRVEEFIKNPKKALLKLALPIVIAMLVQVLYNIVDTAFIGRLGAESIAALTFAFPLFFVLLSLNSGIAVGMSSRISRFLGEKRKEDAENTAMHGLLVSIFFAVILFILGIIFLKQIFVVLGASGETLTLSISYMYIILFGVFFMFPSFVLSSVFTSQGDTKTPMKVHILVLLVNIILDPIFIYVLGYGVKGAAIATVIAFSLSLIFFSYFIRKKSYLKINLKSFKFSFRLIKEILKVGIPASLMMLLTAIYFMFVNNFTSHFGMEYVAGFGIASRLETVIIMPIVAVSIAMLTLVGMFYGAKEYGLLKKITWFSIKITVLFTMIIGAVFFILPSLFLRIFTNDLNLLEIGANYLKVNVLAYPLLAIVVIASRAMQGLGLGFPGFVINLTRVIFVGVPLAYLFVFVFGYGYLSVIWAMVIGSVVSAIVAVIWLMIKFRSIDIHKTD